jgi:hypothetical protein
LIRRRGKPRIVRREIPPRMAGARGYLRAREHLRRDFECRCAYCMTHEDRIDVRNFDIDHFRPQGRGGPVNDYRNLYWSCKHCNSSKGDAWPSLTETRQGWRFADPCAEQDYGVHFVENDQGVLEPRTLRGEYHVERLRLNRPWLVARRLERRQNAAHLGEVEGRLGGRLPTSVTPPEREALVPILDFLRAQLETAIPFIPAPAESAEDE